MSRLPVDDLKQKRATDAPGDTLDVQTTEKDQMLAEALSDKKKLGKVE